MCLHNTTHTWLEYVILESVYAMFVRFRLFESVIGAFEIPVAFNFYVEDTKQQFTIAREIVSVIFWLNIVDYTL